LFLRTVERIQEFKNSRIQEFKNSRIQEFKNSRRTNSPGPRFASQEGNLSRYAALLPSEP
jgi:hypothetical protein